MADTWIKVRNKFFKKKPFRLAKVQFRPGDTEYTYAFHIKQDVKVNDYVVVPVGAQENVFAEHLNNIIDHVGIARVTDITNDKGHIPKTVKLKCILDVIEPRLYIAITKKHEAYTEEAIEL